MHPVGPFGYRQVRPSADMALSHTLLSGSPLATSKPPAWCWGTCHARRHHVRQLMGVAIGAFRRLDRRGLRLVAGCRIAGCFRRGYAARAFGIRPMSILIWSSCSRVKRRCPDGRTTAATWPRSTHLRSVLTCTPNSRAASVTEYCRVMSDPFCSINTLYQA